MNPLKILLMGSKELAALKISDAGQILIYVVYGAIILAFTGAFVRIYKEFGLGKIIKSIREGRDPVKEKSFNREICKTCKEIRNLKFDAWLEKELKNQIEATARFYEEGDDNQMKLSYAIRLKLEHVLKEYRK